VTKLSVTHLQNPYKSNCSYYDTNQNPFNSVSCTDCLKNCLATIYNKCKGHLNYRDVSPRIDKSLFDSKVECNQNDNYVLKKCGKICPIDCLSEYYFYKNFRIFYKLNETFDANKSLKVLYYFWDSTEPFFSYEETADMLLIDYFAYIGGLFGLWFGICLESLLDIIIKNTINLKTKVKLQVKKISSFIQT
jgi:hypothetical protein